MVHFLGNVADRGPSAQSRLYQLTEAAAKPVDGNAHRLSFMPSSWAAPARGRFTISPVSHGLSNSNSRSVVLRGLVLIAAKARSTMLSAHSRSNNVSAEGAEPSAMGRLSDVRFSVQRFMEDMTAAFFARLVNAPVGQSA
jgi:hypothetical protein